MPDPQAREWRTGRRMALLAVLALSLTLTATPAAAVHPTNPACYGSADVDLRALGGDPVGDTRPPLEGSQLVDLRALGGDPAGHTCFASGGASNSLPGGGS